MTDALRRDSYTFLRKSSFNSSAFSPLPKLFRPLFFFLKLLLVLSTSEIGACAAHRLIPLTPSIVRPYFRFWPFTLATGEVRGLLLLGQLALPAGKVSMFAGSSFVIQVFWHDILSFNNPVSTNILLIIQEQAFLNLTHYSQL